MLKNISFKSYCWKVGTTSFRTDNFNYMIEKQLDLLSQFRGQEEHKLAAWNNDLQREYYDFLQDNEFVKGEANRPDKDARQKTSGLYDIGLIDSERFLTEAGETLLNIAKEGNFESDNFLGVPKDSFIYFKQMLKASTNVDGNIVRPYVVFLYVISKVEYLTYDEFTYLLPLCLNEKLTENIIDEILEARKTGRNCDDVIISILMSMNNYQEALSLFLENPVTEELICAIGINRKSRSYDKPYFKLYKTLEAIVLQNDDRTPKFFAETKNLSIGTQWRKYFFSTSVKSIVERDGKSTLKELPIMNAKTEDDFKREFFRVLHLLKAKATLSDYFDLNRRYFKATDTVIFEDGCVKLDILPKFYLNEIAAGLKKMAFSDCDLLPKNVDLIEIDDMFEFNEDVIYENLSDVFGVTITNQETALKVIKDERYERFNKLIDDRFTVETLIELFTKFENREDDEIKKIVTDNADIPTIFEYVLAIAWYIISDRQGDVLEYMNLSLEADLLPKTHAGGGEADIVWEYPKTEWYPKHALLIEATLSEATSQRRMEMEPVSRHLGDYRLSHPDIEAYCVFVATYLHTNVIADFRGRKNMYYYNNEGDFIYGMKILPIATAELKTLLRFNVKYPQIFRLLEEAFNKEEPIKEWYQNNIVKETSSFEFYKA